MANLTDTFFWLARRIGDFRRATGGNVAMVFAIALVPVVGLAGGAIDLTHVESVKHRMQEAADSAALEAMVRRAETDSVRIESAQDLANENLADTIDRAGVDIAVSVTGTEAVVDMTAQVPTTLMGLLGIDSIETSVSATARITAGDTLPVCVLALNRTERKGIEASGGTNFYAEDCIVHVNSNSAEAVNFSGGSTLTSGGNCFVGGVKQGLSAMSPAPSPGCEVMADPFENHYRPRVGPCDHTDTVQVSGHETFQLYPGTYCGGINVSSADRVVFNPGVYVIVGEFRSTGGSTMVGEGVSFYLTGEDAGLEWSGGGVFNFTAPRTGPMRSMLVMLDPDEPDIGVRSHISGGGDTYYEGNIYLPNQLLVVSGGGITNNPSPYTALIADRFLYSGGSTLRIGIDRDNASVPVSSELYASANQRLVLVR